MPRRCTDNSCEDDSPKKKNCNVSVMCSFDPRPDEFLRDVTGKQWKLGKAVGVGGFGEIFLASDDLNKEVKTDSSYVAKVESHKNGPLFVEVNCYLRIAKPTMIEEWKKQKRLSALGMPHYVASGSHMHKGERYRFLILPKFDNDLERVLGEKKILNVKTVLTITSQVIDVLEYIHSKGYIHSDIKASNILLSNKKIIKKSNLGELVHNKYAVCNPVRTCRIQKTTRFTRNLRPQSTISYVDDTTEFDRIFDLHNNSNDFHKQECTKDQVYLLDYGLASKFATSNGEHKPFCVDERRAHTGTILFCSRDAHKGVFSRRSDLESLGYNMIYWLTGSLPWIEDVDNPEIVAKTKQKLMGDIEYFLKKCFIEYPKFLLDYFRYLQNLQFQENPDYSYCKKLFKQSIKESGYKDDSTLDFDNRQSSRPAHNKIRKKVSENLKIQRFIHKISRLPLQSNIPVKPLLRKKVKTKITKNKSNWFEVLTDPEIILKQAREKRNTENSDTNTNIAEMDIDRLNPTYAMIEIYNKCRERIDASPTYKGDSSIENIDGYTQAMMSVVCKIKKNNELQFEQSAVNLTNKNAKILKRCNSRRKKKSESPRKSPLQSRISKSTVVMKKEHFHTRKAPLRRTYSLRG